MPPPSLCCGIALIYSSIVLLMDTPVLLSFVIFLVLAIIDTTVLNNLRDII